METVMSNRVFRALGAVIIAITVGTAGFWLILDGRASLGDCLYMTIITLSTVGYGEVIPMTTGARFFASFLIIFGMGSLIYFGSTVVAFFIEIDLQQVRRRRRMQKTINELDNHVIVCGVGTTGVRVVHELISAKMPFVMIEAREERGRFYKASDLMGVEGMTEEIYRQAAEIDPNQYLRYSHKQNVSGDIIGNPHSVIFDALLTQVLEEKMIKTIGWYDNEWGYSTRVEELIERVARMDGLDT